MSVCSEKDHVADICESERVRDRDRQREDRETETDRETQTETNMPDTPPNPHSRSATATDEQGDTDPDPRRDPRSHSNGEASAGRPATEPVEMEEWDEDEQDNPATDYYAVLNVPRDVLGPLPSPSPSSTLSPGLTD